MTTTVVKNLTDLRADGTTFGQSTSDLISFYGKTPIVQPSSASQAAVSTTTSSAAATTVVTTASSGTNGYATTTQAKDIASLVDALRTGYNIVRPLVYQQGVFINQLRTDLVALGVIKGAA